VEENGYFALIKRVKRVKGSLWGAFGNGKGNHDDQNIKLDLKARSSSEYGQRAAFGGVGE
jgi:hypothetical protein